MEIRPINEINTEVFHRASIKILVKVGDQEHPYMKYRCEISGADSYIRLTNRNGGIMELHKHRNGEITISMPDDPYCYEFASMYNVTDQESEKIYIENTVNKIVDIAECFAQGEPVEF